MKQYVLQIILKIKPIYSAGCLKGEEVSSSEHPEDKANIFCRMSQR
jgi:hypothetical protein